MNETFNIFSIVILSLFLIIGLTIILISLYKLIKIPKLDQLESQTENERNIYDPDSPIGIFERKIRFYSLRFIGACFWCFVVTAFLINRISFLYYSSPNPTVERAVKINEHGQIRYINENVYALFISFMIIGFTGGFVIVIFDFLKRNRKNEGIKE